MKYILRLGEGAQPSDSWDAGLYAGWRVKSSETRKKAQSPQKPSGGVALLLRPEWDGRVPKPSKGAEGCKLECSLGGCFLLRGLGSKHRVVEAVPGPSD